MRKLVNIWCLILCAVLVLSFASCTKDEASSDENVSSEDKPFEPATADELWNKIDETMTALEAYRSGGTMQMTFYNMGMKCDAVAAMTGVYSGKNGEKYVYELTEMEVVCEEISLKEKFESVTAYYNGKMYVANKDDTVDQKLCSAITYEEFEESQKDPLMDEMDTTDCTKSEFSKNDDGTWSLKFSGYTKKTVNVFMEGSGITDQFGAEVVDMEVDVTADSEFRASKIVINFVFDTDEDSTVAPVLTITTEYSNYNDVLPNYEDIKAEEYTEVCDVRLLEQTEDAIKDIKDAKSGGLTLDIKQVITAFGEESVYVEKDTLSYGEQNGGYYYDLVSDSDDGLVTVNYKNGIQTITQGSDTESYAQTDEEAKLVVGDMIDTAGYDAAYVTGIEKVNDGVYKFIFAQPEASVYEEYFEEIGVEYRAATQEIIITMEGESVAKIDSKVKVTGVYKTGTATEDVTLTFDTVIIFGEVSNSAVVA